MSIAFLKNCRYNSLGKLNIIGYWTLRWMIAIFKWSDSKSTKRKGAFVAKVARYIFCIVACKFQGCGLTSSSMPYSIYCYWPWTIPAIYPVYLFSLKDVQKFINHSSPKIILSSYFILWCIYIYMSLTATIYWVNAGNTHRRKRKDITSINNTSLT